MIKKFLSVFLFAICLFIGILGYENVVQSANIKPLKIEHNTNGYGNIETKLKKTQTNISEDYSTTLKKEAERKEPSIFRIFNSLIFVIFLILLTGWVYMKIKKINPEQLLSGKFNNLNENNFKIISSMQLGAGKAIYLIEINNKQLIVGTTASNVNLLAQMDKIENKNEIPQESIEKLFETKTDEFKKLEE